MNLEKKAVWLLVGLLVVCAGVMLAKKKLHKEKPGLPEVSVTIEGSVRKPGTYYVPLGTTRFELLRVAGVLPNSDLNNVDVYAQVTEGENISIGKLEKNVSIKAGSNLTCLVNFVVGDVTIMGKSGMRKPEREMPVFEGEKVLCNQGGTIELKLGDESLIDIKSKSDFLIRELYKTTETGQTSIDFLLSSGKLWGYIKPQSENLSMKFSTPHMVAEIKGTEIDLIADTASSTLNVIKGMVNAGKTNSDRRLSVTEGQKAIVSADPAQEIAIGNVTDEDKQRDAELQALQQEKEKVEAEGAIRRFLILLLPDYYIVTEFNPNQGLISINRVAPSTNVSDYIEGVNDLAKVYLYGGIRLTTSVVERMSRKRIEHYAVFDRTNMVDFINHLGGVWVNVEGQAATVMGIKPGLTKLSGELAVKFVGSARYGSFAEESQKQAAIVENQNFILRSIYESALNNKLAFTKVLFTSLLQGVETDMDAAYSMKTYDTFKSKKDWKMEFAYIVPR